MRSMIDLCFMCSSENKCYMVDNKIIGQIEYLMPEITIIKLKLPLRFCSICEQNLQMFSTFKKNCMANSLRLVAQIKQAQDNTDVTEKCTTSKTKNNKIEEVYIKEELLDKSDTLEVKYSLVDDIYIKEDPIPENFSGRELNEEISQTDTNFHVDSNIDMGDQSDKNSDYPDYIVSNNNEIKFDDNILVTDNTGSKIYTCLICKKNFKMLSYLKCHMKIHIGKKEFQCSDCKKLFLLKSNLIVHMKQHTGVKEYQCNECKKLFLYRSNLIAHMKQHTGVKDFQCIECKKLFLYKSNLTKHMKKHTRVKDFQCT